MKNKTELANKFNLFIRIIAIIGLAGAAIAVVGGIVAMCLPDEMFAWATMRIKLSNITFSFDKSIITPFAAKGLMLLQILRGLAIALIAFVICLFVSKIMHNGSRGKLFGIENVRNIRVVGIVVCLLSIVPNTTNSLIDIFTLEGLGGAQVLQDMGVAINVNTNFVSIFVFLFGVLIILLAEVFRRGKFLQEEYDSTI